MWFNSTSMKWMVVHKPIRYKTARLFFTTILITFNNLPCVKGLKCRQNGGIVRCCTNFREEGDTCLPCIGSFGVNCTGGTCVEGFYGFGCREKCNCSIHEVCDHRIGCQKKASSTKTETSSSAVIVTICGVILCFFILLLAVVLRSKMLLNCLSIHRTRQRENTNGADTRSQNYESADNQTYVDCDPVYVTGENQAYIDCDPISVTEDRYPENQFEYSNHSEVISELDVSPVELPV